MHFNPFNAPTEIAWGKVRKWQQRDDVYQVGLLAAILLRGDIDQPMRNKDVRILPCSDHLKEVIHRCLGARDRRYEAASDLRLVQSKPGQSTDVLVKGRPNALQIAGTAGGTKLMELRRLAAKGIRINITGEKKIWKLSEAPVRQRRHDRAAAATQVGCFVLRR